MRATNCSFYDHKRPGWPDAIVTNPPFAECGWGNGKARWLIHALEVLDVEYMALLLNWTWPGAGGLAPFWAKHPCARVYLMRWKIDFTGQGAPPMLNGWFVWDKAHRGETVLRMLDRATRGRAKCSLGWRPRMADKKGLNKYRYAIIPAAAITDPEIAPRILQVLCLLGRHTDENGWCRRSQVKMADELNCGRATVQRALQHLYAAGYVQRRDEGALHHGGVETRKQPFEYFLPTASASTSTTR